MGLNRRGGNPKSVSDGLLRFQRLILGRLAFLSETLCVPDQGDGEVLRPLLRNMWLSGWSSSIFNVYQIQWKGIVKYTLDDTAHLLPIAKHPETVDPGALLPKRRKEVCFKPARAGRS